MVVIGGVACMNARERNSETKKWAPLVSGIG